MTDHLANRLDENAAKFPDKAAFVFYRKDSQWDTITFKNLLDKTNRLALGLRALRLAPGTRAALMVPPSVEFFALAFALLKTGIVPIIVDPAIGLQNVTECFKESKPEIFIGNSLTHAIRILFGWGKETIKVNTSIAQLSQIAKRNSEFHPSSLRQAQGDPFISHPSIAAIIYTSGSTGLPKGAIYTHENFAAQLDMLARTFSISTDEIDLPAFPLFALIDCLLGVTAIIPDIKFPPPAKINPEKISAAANKFNVNNMFASPIVLDRLATYGVKHQKKFTSLKRVITAGAPAPVQVLEDFRKVIPEDSKLFGVYGATETLPVTVIDSQEILNGTRFKSERGAGVCIGQPVDGAEVRIIRTSDSAIQKWDDSLILPMNEIGEITVAGCAVTEKYIGDEEKNRLSKICDGEKIIHRMGDVGYFDEAGRLWYCGRKSHRVVVNNEIFFTECIEGIFNAHPLVYRTALAGVNGEPVLWIELEKDSRHADKEKIKEGLSALAKNHPQASQIKTFLFMKKFPTDVRHNSKIIREKLTIITQKINRKDRQEREEKL